MARPYLCNTYVDNYHAHGLVGIPFSPTGGITQPKRGSCRGKRHDAASPHSILTQLMALGLSLWKIDR